MKPIYLWGSGDGAVEVLHILEDLELYQVCGVVSRHQPEYESLKAYPFFDVNDPSYKENIKNTSSAVVTVGDPYMRERMLEEHPLEYAELQEALVSSETEHLPLDKNEPESDNEQR